MYHTSKSVYKETSQLQGAFTNVHRHQDWKPGSPWNQKVQGLEAKNDAAGL